MSVLTLMNMIIAHFFNIIDHAQKVKELALCLLGYKNKIKNSKLPT